MAPSVIDDQFGRASRFNGGCGLTANDTITIEVRREVGFSLEISGRIFCDERSALIVPVTIKLPAIEIAVVVLIDELVGAVDGFSSSQAPALPGQCGDVLSVDDDVIKGAVSSFNEVAPSVIDDQFGRASRFNGGICACLLNCLLDA